MINRQLLKQRADTLTESEVVEVLEYISIMESLTEQRLKPDPLLEALLKVLSEAMKRRATDPEGIYQHRKVLTN